MRARLALSVLDAYNSIVLRARNANIGYAEVYLRQSKNVLSKLAPMVGMNMPTSLLLKAMIKRVYGVLKIPLVN